jgi:molecular chaperone DnaJ
MADFYAILGVARDADQDTIKKAYRKLAMQFHPDKNPGNKEAEEKFKEAATAYEVLGNGEKRAYYDRFGQAPGAGGRGGAGFQDINDIFASFSDIFGDFFGGQRSGPQHRNRPQRGSDLRYMLEITLQDVVRGLEKDIEFEADESCVRCSGSGAEKGSTAEACPTCGGSGQVVRAQGFFSVATTCPACRGQGQIIRKPCGDCRGSGRKDTHRKIRINVPPGVDTGTQLRITGEGEGGFRGGPAGDLYVQVRVKDDERFQRDNTDLVGQAEISFLQALLGAQVDVETFDGVKTLDIPRGVQAGDTLTLPGLGIPSLRGSGRGDILFEVQILMPKKLKKEEEKLLRELAKLRGEKVAPESGGKGLFGR